jgi:moderate conductance mechanosensitive channel
MPVTDLVQALVQATPTAMAENAWDRLWDAGDGPLAKFVQVVVIVAIALLARTIAKAVIGGFVNRVVSGVKKRQRLEDTQALLASPVSAARVVQRTRTLGSVLNNIVVTVIVIIALLLIVTTIDPNITGAFSLITAALGAGLGFGAQNIVKDVLTGLFMVADDQLGVGDIVATDLATGVVEGVGIRVTQIRDVNGTLWFVRNGEITRVGNMSHGWSRAVIDVTVPNTVDVEAVQQRMLDLATSLSQDPQWRHTVVDQPELWGIESVKPDAVVLRLVLKTRITTRDDVAWAMRVALRQSLADLGGAAEISSAPLERFEQAGTVRSLRARALGRSSGAGSRSRRSAAPTRTAESEEPATVTGDVPTTAPAAGRGGRTGARGATGASGAGAPTFQSDNDRPER